MSWICAYPMAPMLVVGAIGLVFLYRYNPQDISFFPCCPFYVLTGLKCPGCGTLRAIHALLHFHLADAFRLNPFMLISIPVLLGMVISKKIAFNVILGRSVLAVVLVYWVVRNLFAW